MPIGLFVTGTDTNVGKTHVASLILRSLRTLGIRVGAYKPVCSGAILTSPSGPRWEDIDRLRDAVGCDFPDEAICPQRFLAPLAPPLAARAEGRTIDAARLVSGLQWWQGRADVVVVEGAGGLLAPVTETETVADLARSIGFPLIVVARCGLGTINHSLLTLEAARLRQLAVAGVVLNQCRPDDDRSLAEDNATEIESRGGVPVLGIIDWGSVDGLQRHGHPVTIPWRELINHRERQV
jgi:dethiobiotin synthetase